MYSVRGGQVFINLEHSRSAKILYLHAALNSTCVLHYGTWMFFAGPMMRPQMAQQQQQQALHAAGGNMYMGGGGMAAIGSMHQMHQRLGYPRTNNQRPPNVSVGPPDGLGNSIAGRGAQQEWRHVLMQQQQQQGFQAQMRSQFNQQGHQSEYRGTGPLSRPLARRLEEGAVRRSKFGQVSRVQSESR